MKLFDEYRLGAITLPNRVVMAPMTRNRAPGTVQSELAVEYYRQRAGAGLIVTEGTQVSRLGQGYRDTPGIFTVEQGAAWRRVTEAVHGEGGRIFAQLWHVGRVSHSCYHGESPVAPSALAAPGSVKTPEGPKPFETPRALSTEEVGKVVEEFRHAARIAKEAGFDGVEIHGANGYLIDQFLQSGTNRRTDRYGGSAENRARFALEVVEAVSAVWGTERVGIRLAPGGTNNGLQDDDPAETFSTMARALNPYRLAYLHVVNAPVGERTATELMREHYHGTLIANREYTRESAEVALSEGWADMIAFGRAFLANPDLVERFRENEALNAPDRATFYSGGAKGYTDYPPLGVTGAARS